MASYIKVSVKMPDPEKTFGLNVEKLNRLANSAKQTILNDFARVNQRDLKNAVKISGEVKASRTGFRINISQEVVASLAKSKVGTIENKYKYQQERISQLQTKYNSMKSSMYSTYANSDGSLPFTQQAALNRAQAQLSRLQQQNIRLKNKLNKKSKLKGSGPTTAIDFLERHPKFLENLRRKLETKIANNVVELFLKAK